MTVETQQPTKWTNVNLPEETIDTDKRIQNFYSSLNRLKALKKSEEGRTLGAILDYTMGLTPKIKDLANLAGISIEPSELMMTTIVYTPQPHIKDSIEIDFIPHPGGKGIPRDAIRTIKISIQKESENQSRIVKESAQFDSWYQHVMGFNTLPYGQEAKLLSQDEMFKKQRADLIDKYLTNPLYANFQLSLFEELVNAIASQIPYNTPRFHGPSRHRR